MTVRHSIGASSCGRLATFGGAAVHVGGRSGDDPQRGRVLRALCDRHGQHRAGRPRDGSRARPHPLHPAQPPLQRLDPPSPRGSRDAACRGLARQAARVRRAVGARGATLRNGSTTRPTSNVSGSSARTLRRWIRPRAVSWPRNGRWSGCGCWRTRGSTPTSRKPGRTCCTRSTTASSSRVGRSSRHA
jgi:hypothetical protein